MIKNLLNFLLGKKDIKTIIFTWLLDAGFLSFPKDCIIYNPGCFGHRQSKKIATKKNDAMRHVNFNSLQNEKTHWHVLILVPA